MSNLPVPHCCDSWAHQQRPIAAPNTGDMVATFVLELGEMAGGEEAPE
jgi:hypothetical protein